MHLAQLRLHNFRSYQQVTLLPPDGVTIIVGENGAGKTNLLEAIHLCCLGRSHRTSSDQDMIRLGQETCGVHARVKKQSGLAAIRSAFSRCANASLVSCAALMHKATT